jgi:Spy/CpxP family protein refolding chaperone
MKKYIASLTILAAALSLAVSAHAQAAGSTGTQQSLSVPTPGKHAGGPKILQNVIAKMNLTEDQKAKIKDAVKANAKEVLELRRSVKAGTVTKEDAKTKQKELHKSLMESIKALMTPAQVKEFDEALKEAAKKAKEEKKEATKTGGGGL